MKKVDWSLLICCFIAILCFIVCAFGIINLPLWANIVIAVLLFAACIIIEFIKENNSVK